MQAEAVDVTIPGRKQKLGHQHPMYIALDEIKDIFVGMGFTVLDGPEVELADYNFDTPQRRARATPPGTGQRHLLL